MNEKQQTPDPGSSEVIFIYLFFPKGCFVVFFSVIVDNQYFILVSGVVPFAFSPAHPKLTVVTFLMSFYPLALCALF